MKFTRFLLHTHRQAPAEAEVISHQLMIRAGMIKRLAAGIYSYMPLGLRALRKFEQIVREEMNRAGAQELLMPAVQPGELWEESGRWKVYGKELLRLKDRQQRDYCFGPTHEEVVTDICRKEVRSYRDLPLNLYQIQTKFRDEVRPRFGLMRGREFVMKDAYSFDVDAKAAEESYWQMFEVYKRIFSRCGLSFRPVEAVTGNIGGTLSHEFQVLASSGEDLIVSCGACEYAANIEKAALKPVDHERAPGGNEKVTRTKIETPGKHSVEEVCVFLKKSPAELIKTLIYGTPKGFVAALVRGDHEVNEHKLKIQLDVDEVQLASPEEILSVTGGPQGFSGPEGLKIPLYMDYAINPGVPYVAGANEKDQHFLQLVPDQLSAKPQGMDLRMAQAKDPCPRCAKGILELHRGIEVGQVFFLGTKYSEALKATYLDSAGKESLVVMGCYGIGIGRTVAAAIEQSHDEKGIIFPMPLAPFQVILIALPGKKDADKLSGKANELYEEMRTQGIEVLYDDRDERAGVKFNDADLIGIPLQVILGQKGMDEGSVEIKVRKTGVVEKVSFDKVGLDLKARITRQLSE